MITFPSEDTHPLDSEMFHTKKSIINEHYGFTDGLLVDEPYECELCSKITHSKLCGSCGYNNKAFRGHNPWKKNDNSL